MALSPILLDRYPVAYNTDGSPSDGESSTCYTIPEAGVYAIVSRGPVVRIRWVPEGAAYAQGYTDLVSGRVEGADLPNDGWRLESAGHLHVQCPAGQVDSHMLYRMDPPAPVADPPAPTEEVPRKKSSPRK
jgi:hypothetical protein